MDLNKVFKISITIAILVIAVSISYYYLIFLPNKERAKLQQQKEELIFSMQSKCREMGEKLYNKGVEDLGEYSVFNPEYYYNKKLNTCLYAGGYIKKDYLEKLVRDSFTNKPIITFIEMARENGEREVITFGCPECVSSNEEFEQQKQKLFSE